MMEHLRENEESPDKQLVKPTPEERTDAFWRQDYQELVLAMRGRLIASQSDDLKVRIDDTQGWSKDGNDKAKYLTSNQLLRLSLLRAGVLGAFPYPFRRMTQSLISARDGGLLGACIRLTKVSRYDANKGIFTRLKREGDLVKLLGLDDNEGVRLKFIDDSDILYFKRGEDNQPLHDEPVEVLTREEIADNYLRDLLK